MSRTPETLLKSCALLLASCLLFQVPAQERRPAEERVRKDRPARRPAAGERRGPRVPEGTKILRDVEYAPGGHERQKLDLYVPTAEGKLPLIIWVHGGAWLAGSKDRCRALPFLREGYAVASINYRLSQHAIFPAQIEDCKAAVRWLRTHAPKHGIDPERFGVWGSSAGGHLVALLGTTGDVKEFEKGEHLDVSSRVQAVCDWFGPSDFAQMSKFPSRMDHDAPDSPESKLVGGAIQEHKDKVTRANPITYVSRDDPPFLIMHGDKDPLVPLNQSELLEATLKKAGVRVKLHVVRGGGHGFGGPEIEEMVRAFFAKHLKESSPEEKGAAASEEGSKPREYAYKKTPQGELKVAVHFPPGWKKTDKRPAIVFFFGGGWRSGTTRQFLQQAEYLASRGMVTARADYRVKSRHQTGPEKCVEDAKSAVRWLRQKAPELGIDPKRIVGSGGSAGGHIAACSLLTKGLEAGDEDTTVSSKPNVLVLFNPVLDLTVMDRKVTGPDGKDLTEQISPTQQLASKMPPTILFYGTRDRFTAQGREFTRRSRELENRVQLYTAEGQPHGFFNRTPWMELTLRRTDEFLTSIGYLEGSPTVEVPQEPELIRE